MLTRDLKREICLIGATEVKTYIKEANSPVGKFIINKSIYKLVNDNLEILFVLTDNTGVKHEFLNEDPRIVMILKSKNIGEKIRIFHKGKFSRFVDFFTGSKINNNFLIKGSKLFKVKIFEDEKICSFLNENPLSLYSNVSNYTYTITLIPLSEEIRIKELFLFLKSVAKYSA